jgi:hypothetical protein
VADQDRAQDGAADLLGLLAYALLVAFFRLAEDAARAPSLPDKADLATMAVAQFSHFRLVRDRLASLGADPEQAMQPFVPAIEEFHARTVPADWLEGLVKAYVGDGIAADFLRFAAHLLDPQLQSLVLQVLADSGQADFAVARVRAATTADPAVAGRLALYARRMVGEALSEAHRVAAERQALARLLSGGQPGQLGEISRVLATVTAAHEKRMAALGLAS